ncbi:galactokinase [Anaeromyxobacter oryzae]|uniref:Galactokinase n=1 Tax=Anaeromyxobacter oryzae TaxID=2918170 RepID=A0ABM7X0G2_9BACT|nr:galactokinase [Anaeromyxobacter oryzae]BDG05225.1 galactokinase [Anaeromyxobacter oryzae]
MAGDARTFEALFGSAPAVRARAPGRVNLIGEHTDYNGGYVLPMAIPQETRVELAPRDGREVRAWSANLPGGRIDSYVLGEERRGRGWLDYVQGVTVVLAGDGHALRGFDVAFRSDVPLGSGLSSSAALEVSLLRGLREAYGLRLDDVALALAGQRAEAGFVGAPVGVMDQLASSLADARSALFIDTRTLAHERIPLPPAVELVVISSGVSHAHAGGDYRVRRAECERAADLLGVNQLRDLSPADVPRAMSLPEPLGRRVRHVVLENARVLEAVEALRRGDVPGLGALLDASHASQRDDYEVSVPEIDLLVDLARAERDVVGARLTGGGFGGSIVALARAGSGAGVAARVVEAYARRSGRAGRVLVPRG